MELYCKQLPKVELHAHLNGSVSKDTLKKLIDASSGGCSDTSQKYTLAHIPDQERKYSNAFEIFRLLHELVKDVNAIKIITEDVIREFYEDNVLYLELRSTPKALPGSSKRDYLEAIVQTIQSTVKSLDSMIVQFLVSVDRGRSLEDAVENIDLAVEFARLYPDIVVGVDFSGDPTKGDAKEFVPLLKKAKARGLFISVHMAETNNLEDSKTLLAAEPDRLGHAFFVHPNFGGSNELFSHVVDKNIPVEICLTSNLQGGLCISYEEHPLKFWLECNHPVVLCTDDKGLFDTQLSKEYYHASKAHALTKQNLLSISYKAIDFIAGDENVKLYLRSVWNDFANRK